MSFDPKIHEIHPETGFHVHKETGHIVGLVPAPAARVNHDSEWPRWVKPHDSHIVRQSVAGAPDHVSTPHFPHVHVNRVDGTVTVLVENEDEEKRATEARVVEVVEIAPVGVMSF